MTLRTATLVLGSHCHFETHVFFVWPDMAVDEYCIQVPVLVAPMCGKVVFLCFQLLVIPCLPIGPFHQPPARNLQPLAEVGAIDPQT